MSGYASALAAVLRGSALPYGYTVTVWTSGMVLTRERGTPPVGDVFLFMAGAVLAFGLLATVIRLSGSRPLEPPASALRKTGMAHFLAVGAALGAAALIAMIHSGIAWPLGAFAATATYLALASIELMVAARYPVES
jgi:hypothetical protein